MKMTGKRIHTILIALACTLVAMAQPQRSNERDRFNPEEFKAHLEAHITRSAHLTTEESQKFFPLFYEMKEKQRQLQKEISDLKKDKMRHLGPGPFHRPPRNAEMKDNISDEEYAKTLMRIKKLNAEMAEVESEYYRKFCREISPKKVFAAMIAEDDFHRVMLSRFNQERKRK